MRKSRKGFTLIELLIVVAIVGILAALLIPNAISAMQRAKQKGTMKEINTLSTGIMDYVTDKSFSPVNATGPVQAGTITALSQLYLKAVPVTDKWGGALILTSGQAAGSSPRNCMFTGTDDFLVESYGRGYVDDGWTFDPALPNAGFYTINVMADFQRDMVMWNGQWIHRPLVYSTAT
jgi:prepilin-type N-terminal cleavage/methylation domain-containing protein